MVYNKTKTMFMIVGITMSLREFIRATAKDLQDVNRAKSAQGTAAEQKSTSSGMADAKSGKAVSGEEERRRTLGEKKEQKE